MKDQHSKIIDNAARLMSEKGYKGTSLQEIADRVGIHKSTLFHYFRNKEELLLEVLRISIEEVTARLNRIINDESASPEDTLLKAMVNHIEMLAKYRDNVNVYHSDIRFLSEEKKRKYLNTRRYYEKCFLKIIDDLKRSDKRHFTNLDDHLVMFGILGMCNWVVKWYKPGGPYSPEEIAGVFNQMIMKGSEFR